MATAAAGIAVRYTTATAGRTARYWSWSNPAVREVSRNVAGIAGTTGAIAGVGTLLAGVLGKRKRTDMSSGYATDTQMGGMGYAGATNVVQRIFRKHRSGRRMRKNVRNAHRLLKASLAYCNFRWQRMYNYSGTGPTGGDIEKQAYPAKALNLNYEIGGGETDQLGRLNLGHVTSGTAGSQYNVMPGYLFNLTSWNVNGATYSPCMRLAFDSTGKVTYFNIASQSQDGEAVNETQWQPELRRGNTYPNPFCQNAFLMWSDIRLAFYGANHCPTRIICEMIQFKKDYFHPGETPTSSEQDEINMHYISEFKKLTFHPLDVQLNNRKANIKVLYSKSYEIGPDTSSSDDPTQPNVLVKIFKNFNRLCNWRWRVANDESTEPNNVRPEDGELDESDWQINDDTQLRQTVAPKARIYLYIRAEAMRSVAFSKLQNDTDVANHCPSMDIMVRQRWQYEA